MQDQENLERWDGIVSAWLAECAELEPDAISIREVVRPHALVISANSAVRQSIQLRLTASGYQTITARDLSVAVKKASERDWSLVAIDEEFVDDETCALLGLHMTSDCEIRVLKAQEVAV